MDTLDQCLARQGQDLRGFQGGHVRRAPSAIKEAQLPEQLAGRQHSEHDLLAVSGLVVNLDLTGEDDVEGAAGFLAEQDRCLFPEALLSDMPGNQSKFRWPEAG